MPVIQHVLHACGTAAAESAPARSPAHGIVALVLVPTKELCQQVFDQFRQLACYAARWVTAVELGGDVALSAQRAALLAMPDIVISTPARVLQHLQSGHIKLRESLRMLVIDESDLLFSLGYEEDLGRLLDYLPHTYQAFLMSATLSADVQKLKKLVLHNPVVLQLQESLLPGRDRLQQYVVRCKASDKYLIIFTLLKLRLVRGKTIIFVRSVDGCYRLKLFLEQFSIHTCVLNSELPLNSRVHVVNEFNCGKYDYVIATDEFAAHTDRDTKDETADVVAAAAIVRQSAPAIEETEERSETRDEDAYEADAQLSEGADDHDGGLDQTASASASASATATAVAGASASATRGTDVPGAAATQGPEVRPGRSRRRDHEYGVSRGVDFRDISNVINFDFPTSARAYIHRCGRTARGDRHGQAISFVCDADGDRVLARVRSVLEDYNEADPLIRGYVIKEQQLEGFRYRVADALNRVTRSAVREARLSELKAEMLNSERLRAHFEDNPMDMAALRHDRNLRPMDIQTHLKYIPDYLLPAGYVAPKGSMGSSGGLGPSRRDRRRGPGGGRGGRKKRDDPLRSFRYTKRRRD